MSNGSAQPENVSGRLWDRYGSLAVDDIPPEVRTVATQCVLDWFGCALAGSREPVAAIVRDEAGAVPGPASLVGVDRAARTGVLQAALVNGTAGHALDFDDTNTVMNGHPTAPVLPAALALAEELACSGADLLAAFVVGVEVETRLAAAIGPTHYARGWHATSTIGVLGAAAAASRLLALDAERFGCALGVAASMSGGLKANFGTMTKPFHAGQAAERGLLAARLAARGFTASATALGGRQGLAQAAGAGELDLSRLDRYEGEWLIRRTLFKYHAACHLTHAAIEATSGLLGELGGRPVDGVTVTVHPSVLDVCAIPRPTTGLEAKFSLAATTALALLGADTADLATFSDARLDDPVLQRQIGSVRVETDPDLRPTQSRVELVTAGAVHRGAFDTGVPATDLEAQGAKLRAKFAGLAAPVLGPPAADRLAASIGTLADLPTVLDLRP